MSKLAVVVGATGTQGGSVVQSFLKSGRYQVRGLTRNTDGIKARKLCAQGVELVRADLNDLESLISAFKDASVIYGVTDFFAPFIANGTQADKAREVEEAQGRNIVQAAARTPTLEHFIWSTMPDTNLNTQGKVVVPHFQGKSEIDHYIRAEFGETLLPKTTFMIVAGYVDNFFWPPFSPLAIKALGKYAFIQPQDKSTVQPVVGDAATNVGAFALRIAERPDVTRGNKTVLATLGFKTTEEMMLSLGKCLESPIIYTQVDMDTYDALFPGWGKEMGLMVKYFEALGENAWTASGPGNPALIKAEDLDLHVGKELESWEDAMSKKNWKSVFS